MPDKRIAIYYRTDHGRVFLLAMEPASAKGREISGIILDNMMQGRNKARMGIF